MPLDEADRPQKPVGRIPIRRINEQVYRQFIVLGSRVRGYLSHWSGASTVAHVNHGARCPGCAEGWPERWHGFLHCWDVKDQRECFVELPQGATRTFEAMYGTTQDLRGCKFQAQRHGRGANGRISFGWLPPCDQIDKYPPEKSPSDSLEWFWGTGG